MSLCLWLRDAYGCRAVAAEWNGSVLTLGCFVSTLPCQRNGYLDTYLGIPFAEKAGR